MTHEYNTVELKKRHKILVTCRLCRFTLSEAVQTEQDMIDHDRIWHQRGTTSYFLVHERAAATTPIGFNK